MNLTPTSATVEQSKVAQYINPTDRQCIVLRIREFINAVNRCYWVLSPVAVVNQAACEFLPPRVAIALSWNTDETMKLWAEAMAQCRTN